MNRAPDTNGGLVAWTIDDSEFDLKLNQRILTQSGVFAHIKGFFSADDALEELRRAPALPHVIFLDIMMPIKNGFEFLTEATAEHGDAFSRRVVIMLTSSLNPADRAKAKGFAAVKGFLPKPFTTKDSHQIAAQAAHFLNGTPPDESRESPG